MLQVSSSRKIRSTKTEMRGCSSSRDFSIKAVVLVTRILSCLCCRGTQILPIFRSFNLKLRLIFNVGFDGTRQGR